MCSGNDPNMFLSEEIKEKPAQQRLAFFLCALPRCFKQVWFEEPHPFRRIVRKHRNSLCVNWMVYLIDFLSAKSIIDFLKCYRPFSHNHTWQPKPLGKGYLVAHPITILKVRIRPWRVD